MRPFLFIFLVSLSVFGNSRKVIKDSVGYLNSKNLITKDHYYDFWLMRANQSREDYESKEFFGHIELTRDSDSIVCQFDDFSKVSMIALGKMNLDSVKTAPIDEMKIDIGMGVGVIFKESFAKLDDLKGQCFVLQTSDKDPRLGNMQFQVKMKVLDFKINDLENEDVDMKFVWMANFGGLDMTTEEPIDTFDITGVVNESINHKPSGSTSYQVLDNKVILNSKLVNDVSASVYNVSGRLLYRTPLKANTTEFVLPQGITTRPIFIDFK